MTKMMMKIMIMMNEDSEEENPKNIKNMKISQKNINIHKKDLCCKLFKFLIT